MLGGRAASDDFAACSATLLGPTQNQNLIRDCCEVAYGFSAQPGSSCLSAQVGWGGGRLGACRVSGLSVQDNYLSGRRNRVSSRWRGSSSWIRRWKAGGRGRRMSTRQAFREQFVLHRTETGNSESSSPCSPHSRGGEGFQTHVSGRSRCLCLCSRAAWLLATRSNSLSH